MTRSQATPASSQMIAMERMIAERDDEITRLRQQVQELQDLITEMPTVLRRERSKLEESQAKEAKLREALRTLDVALKVGTPEYGYDDLVEIISESIALPQDDTALKEFRKRVLLEAAEQFTEHFMTNSSNWFYVVRELRRMAEDVK